MPKGYIIGHVTIHDPDAYQPYRTKNNEIFPKFGGKFLVRGGQADVLEGSLPPRHVIVEFPNYADALACYNSAEYQENMQIRRANSDGAIMVVEGV